MNRWLKRMAACLLVLALVFPAFSVPETAAAASKITLKSGATAPSTIYAGHSYTLDVKGANVKYYSSNKKIATIGLTTGKLKPTEPGSVKITAKSKKTGKIVAFKTFKVLKRSTSVSAEPKTVYLGRVGDTAQFQSSLKPANSTDVIRYVTSDKTIAAVGLTSGKVTARGIGKTTIQVYAKATKATSSSNKYNKKTTVDVYVGPYLAQAEQTQLAQVKLTFKDSVDVYAFQPSDFTITNDETKVNCPIKAVSKSSGNEVTLTLHNELRDGKTYTVSNNMSSAKFTATDMQIAGLRIEPTEAEIQKSTQISLALLDKDGIIVKRCYANNTPSNIDFEVKAEGGYVFHGGMLYLSSMSSKGIAKATYHSGNFVNGKEVGNIETGEVIITPLKQKEEEKEPIYSGGYSPYNVRYTIEEEIPRGLETDNDASTDKRAEGADDSTASETSTRGYVKATDFNQPIQTIYLGKVGNDTSETGGDAQQKEKTERSTDVDDSKTESEQKAVTAKFRIYMNGNEVDYTQYTVSVQDPNIVEASSTDAQAPGQAGKLEKGILQPVSIGREGYIQLTPCKVGVTNLVLRHGGQVIRNLPITVSSDESKPYKVVFFDDESITSQITLERFPDYTKLDRDGNPSYADMTASLQVLLKDQYGKMLRWDKYPDSELKLENNRYAEGVIKFDNVTKKLSVDVSMDTAASASLPMYFAALSFTYAERENHRGTIYASLYVRTKHPNVTVKRDESVTYDPAKMKNYYSYYDLIKQAYTVYINGLKIEETQDPSQYEGYYISSYGPKYGYGTDLSIENGITFKRLSFTISYRARKNGDITWFNAECKGYLGTIQPKAKVVESENGTENGSTVEATPPDTKQEQNPEQNDLDTSTPKPGDNVNGSGVAASNAAGAAAA